MADHVDIVPHLELKDGKLTSVPGETLPTLPPGEYVVIAKVEAPPTDKTPVKSEPLKITDSFLGQNLKLQGVKVSPPTPATVASPHQQSLGYPVGSQPKSIFDFGRK